MNVRLPDGTIVTNVPEGTTQAEVLRMLGPSAGGKPFVSPAETASVASEYGPLQAGVIATGRTLDRLGKGVKQMALNVPAGFGHQGAKDEIARMEREEADNSRHFAAMEKEHPIATFIGGALPLLAAPALGAGTLGMAAGAALPGLIEYGTPEEKLTRGGMGAVGGAAGAALGKLAGRAAQPVRHVPTQTEQAAQGAAKRLGVQLRVDELTRSRPLGWATAALNDLPVSGGMAQAKERARQAAINSAATRSLGQSGGEVTEQVLASARRDTGAMFDSLLKQRQIPLDATFRKDVQSIVGSKVMKSLRDEEVESIIAPFQNMPTGGNIKVSGEWFQQNKTALDSVIRSAYNNGQPAKAKALEDFERALERAAQRSMSPQEAEAFKQAQKQWASLRMLETGKVVEGGNVMPGRLDSAMTTRYKHAYKEGKVDGELADIGRLAQVYKPLPQSGTTPRSIYSGMAGGSLFVDPVLSAGMLGVPPALQAALQSAAGRKYLTKGLFGVTPEMERALMLSGAGAAAAPATIAAPATLYGGSR